MFLRRSIFIVVAIGALLASPTAQQNAPGQGAPEDENARHAHQLVNQMIDALGGQAYMTMQDYEYEGRSYGFSHGQPASVGTPVWRFWKWPDKERAELTKQRDVVEIFNGDAGWEVTYKGAGFQPPAQLAEYKLNREYSLANILRVWLKSPQVAFFYAGTAMAEQRMADHITIYDGEKAADLFLDTGTHLPIKKSFKHRDPQYHDQDVEEEVWGNYQVVQGINTPRDYLRRHNGDTVVQRFIAKIKYNQGLSDSLFVPKKMPPGAPPANPR